jgi:hypothetical protein
LAARVSNNIGGSYRMHERLVNLEHDLTKVQGVMSARVVGEEEPAEIHIVSSLDRAPKQVVRDVQSLAAARFGMPIDHRIVSVVQLDENQAVSAPQTTAAVEIEAHRPVLERVVVASKGESSWIKVALVWPDGETTEGAGTAGATRETRARGATVALLQALGAVLERRDSRVDVDHVLIHRIGSSDSVLIRAVFHERGAPTSLVGSAVVYDDVATAAVQALLQAVNRKLGSA